MTRDVPGRSDAGGVAQGARDRFIVINADDLGISKGTTLAIMQAHNHGIVTSASLVTTTAAYDHALKEISSVQNTLGIGLHFTLTAGRPISSAPEVPLLVDSSGNFRWSFLGLLRALTSSRRHELLRQIEIELKAQLGRALRDGISIDHIDGERHVHLLPGVFNCVLRVAFQHHIRHVRLINDIGARYIEVLRAHEVITNGGVAKYLLLRLLTHYGARMARERGFPVNQYASVLYTGRMHRILEKILGDPPQGVTEIAVHPGLPRFVGDEDTRNPELLEYLKSPDRERELNACLRISRNAIPARLIRFSDLG